MPSVTDEAPIELIRQHPDLAVELLRAMSDIDLPAEIAVSLGPTGLSEPRRTDQTILLAGLPHRRPKASQMPARAPAGDLPGS